jgi:Zn-dependent peptidase ImmA (M78 family)
MTEKQYDKIIKENNNQVQFSSEFLEGINIVLVFKEDPLYDKVKDFFKEYGFGFMVPKQNLIIIDGEILIGRPDAKDILKFIEAHEVSHILLNHDGPRNNQDEIEADLGAYLLLKKRGYDNSIDILVNYFEERHGIKFTDELLSNVSDRIY